MANFLKAVQIITLHVKRARALKMPIARVRHHNKPEESKAFIPGTWGSDWIDGLAPDPLNSLECVFQKNVYGAFTGTQVGTWFSDQHVNEVLITGFYTHGCLSTTAHEAIMLGYTVVVDPDATGSCDLEHPKLGRLSAEEVKISALIQLASMGALVL